MIPPADTLSTVTCILKRTPERANFKILSTFKKFHLYQKALYLIFQDSLPLLLVFSWASNEKKKKEQKAT